MVTLFEGLNLHVSRMVEDDIEDLVMPSSFMRFRFRALKLSEVFLLAVGTWPTQSQISDEDRIVLETFQQEFLQCVVSDLEFHKPIPILLFSLLMHNKEKLEHKF